MTDHPLTFTPEEMKRLEKARVLVSASDFHLSQAEFIHHATMQAVDEVLGVSEDVRRRAATMPDGGERA